jgi:hypothetical protein
MVMTRIVFVLLVILLSRTVYGNDCSFLSKYELHNNSDVIFTGYVIESNNFEYKIWVQEVFKGSLTDTLVGIVDQNYLHPKKGTTWLVYASGLEDGEVFIDACSGSKSFQRPYGYHDVSGFIPAPKEVYSSPISTFLMEQIQNARSLNELYFEIISLREINSKKQVSETILPIDEFKGLLERIMVFLVLLTIVSLLQLFLIVRMLLKKRSAPLGDE